MKKTLTVAIGQYNTGGQKKINQDRCGVRIPVGPMLNSKGVAVALADGISSSQVSQIAADAAINGFLEDYYCSSEAWSVRHSATKVLAAVNSWLFAQTRSSPYRFNKDKGYICTFSGLVLKSTTAHVFHVGDARIYRISGDSLEQLTEDHRHVVSEETSYLSRALGINQALDLDYRSLPIELGDTFLLCTDGIYEFISAKEIAALIASNKHDLDVAAKAIVEAALAHGSDDNATVQLIYVEQLPDFAVEELQQKIELLPLPPALRPRMKFDGFEILRELYISSRSHVWLAVDEESGERVVIKTPSVEQAKNTAYLESFLTEEWIARRLNNAHVLKAPEFKRKRNYLYLVTEYIDGKNLAQWMIDNPQPSVEQVRTIIAQAAKGLQAFHRQEMLHQDIRPNNIMIDVHGTVKVIDFGATRVAGLEDLKKKSLQTIVGTAQFTAPEYFIGDPASARADIFSLGVIAYQMLSGKLPYGTAVSMARTRAAQRRLSYQSALSDERDIVPWVDEALRKAVHINPLKRYREVSEFVHDLHHPNAEFVAKARPPLIERNPVAFWQAVSFMLFVALLAQQFWPR